MAEPYTIIKCSLKKFCKREDLTQRIQESVEKVNRITTEAYHLLNLHVRRLLDAKEPIPKLESNYLRQFFYCVSTTRRKCKIPKVDEAILRTKKELYDPLQPPTLYRDGLKGFLNSEAVVMATCIRNNIVMHFFKRQRKYLRLVHPEIPKGELSQFIDQVNEVKGTDVTEPTLPREIIKNVAYDLEKEPEKFLVPMHYMNCFLEKAQQKVFSLVPLRRGFVPKAIRIDHVTLEAFVHTEQESQHYKTQKASLTKKDEPKKKRKKNCTEDNELAISLRDMLWNTYFDLRRIKCRKRKYRFDHSIVTDGVSVSCQFIKKVRTNSTPKKKQKKELQNKGEIDCDSIKNRPVVGIDPGKHSIIYLTSDDSSIKNRMQYTNIQRRVELGRKRFNRKQKEKKMKCIFEAEQVLSQQNSRTVSVEGFRNYIKARWEVQDVCYNHYSNKLFRIHSWWCYQNKQKTEAKLIDRVKEKFGDNAVLAYGTWNRCSQMKGLIPSPTSGIRKLLSHHFTVIDTPEYNTTKLCSKCHTGTMMPVMNRQREKKQKDGTTKMVTYDVRGLRRCNNESKYLIRNSANF